MWATGPTARHYEWWDCRSRVIGIGVFNKFIIESINISCYIVLYKKSRGKFTPALRLPRSFQHIFNKYSVASCGIINKHMSYGTDDFTVLDNRAAAHALYDAAGFF